jgi:hypothetical protein
MKKSLLLIFFSVFSVAFAYADKIAINHFTIKENPFANNEIAVVATDTADNVLENVNGFFTFTVNSFQEVLKFEKGTAFYRHKLEKSTFLYVKHENVNNTYSALYYVYKGDHSLTAIHISWMVLLAIPVILIILAYFFKRFIIIAVIIFILFFYFNHHNGLSIPTFFESIFDGLKGLFGK